MKKMSQSDLKKHIKKIDELIIFLESKYEENKMTKPASKDYKDWYYLNFGIKPK